MSEAALPLRVVRVSLLACALALAVLRPALVPRAAWAGTTGRIVGVVLDEKKKPVEAATVTVPAARLGAVTDAEGRYSIQNVPVGTFDVKIALLGYRPVTITGLVVTADNSSRADAVLVESAIEMKEVVVKAERPVVDVNLTSSLAAVSREEIAKLPVQELQDVVNLQAGVVDGHFRGGRIGEVQYQVDGVTVNNVYDNQAGLRLDRSLLQEVQVISGTFDAEYGQAMSGVVNAVLRRGSDKFEWNAEVFSGGFLYGTDRIVAPDFNPTDLQNYQLSLSGPTPIPKTTYLVNARRGIAHDYIQAVRRFVPTDSSNFETKEFRPTGDGSQVPLGDASEFSGVLKISNRSLSNIEFGYQAVVNTVNGRRSTWAYRVNPDGLSHQENKSLVHGLDWTHTLSRSTFYTLALRQNITDYKDMAYDDLYDPRYDAAGPPIADRSYEDGAFVQGVDFTRFSQRTNTLVVKGSVSHEFDKRNSAKAGLEAQWPVVSFGNPGYLVYTTVAGQEQLVRHDNEPPNYPGVQTYYPILMSAFGQDELEWNDLRLRAGLRLDYFDANATQPSDLANPANSIDGAPESVPVAVDPKVSFAPRLGVSYPITQGSALFFAYGHFYQMPALGTVFTNADYSILSDLQAGGISYGVMGNPDIKPERTVQYQFGFKQALTRDLGLDLSMFYKDIRDLLGVEFISTYNGAEYARLANVDFGSVEGVTLSLNQRNLGPLSATLDYTWQVGRGSSSDPRETATRAAAGEDPRPRQVPFNWDQRHTVNATLTLSNPASYTVSGIFRFSSGQPYTPTVTSGFGGGLETNSGRKPASTIVDLRGEQNLRVAGVDLNLFGRVFNLFDSRFSNGFVFSTTGSPYYSRNPTADEVLLGDPTRYYGPRRLEIGVSMHGGGGS